MKRILAAAFAALLVFAAAGAAADSLVLSKTAETATTLTVSWTPPAGANGYDFYVAGTRVSNTRDGSRSSVRFGKVAACENVTGCYQVAASAEVARGGYPPAPAPPPAACSDGKDNDGDGKVDYPADPGCSSAADTDETDAPPAGSAQLAVSTVGDDSTCVRGDLLKPCRSFDRAYQLAQCGDTVQVGGGAYGEQSFDRIAAKETCTSMVTFSPSTGVSVSVTRFRFGDNGPGPGWIRLQKMKVGAVGAFNGSHDLEWRDLDGGAFYFKGAHNLLLTGNDWGPCSSSGTECESQTTIDSDLGGTGTYNITIDGDTFHDFIINSPGDHWECMYFTGAQGNVTIRNSRFYNCSTYAIYFTGFHESHSYSTANIHVENNWFGRACNSNESNPPSCTTNRASAINLGSDNAGSAVQNLLVRFNSFAPGSTLVTEGGAARTNVRAVGNIFGYWDSGSCNLNGVTFAYNVWLGSGTCGLGGVNVGMLPYVNAANAGASMDYHLSGSTVADNLVPATADSSLNVDRDGQTRPIGVNRDVGADER